MGFFKNLFTKSLEQDAINTEYTSRQEDLSPMPNISSSVENITNTNKNSEKNQEEITVKEEQEKRDQERKELSEKLKVSEDNFINISNQFLSIFDTNPLLEVLKNDTAKMLSDIHKLIKSTDSYIESLAEDEKADTVSLDDIDFDDYDEWNSALEYQISRKATIFYIIEQRKDFFDLISDTLKQCMVIWWDNYRWLFIENENSDIVLTESGIVSTEDCMDSPHVPDYLCTKYDFQSVINIYKDNPLKFTDYHPIFKSIETYISNGPKIDFHSMNKFTDKKKSLDIFNEYDRDLNHFIDYSLSNALYNYFAIITAFYCSVREYSEYGFVEMFSYNCLGNLTNLFQLLHLPVISKISIQKNNLISSNILKQLDKNIINFLKKIFNGAFFDKSLDFISNEQYKGLLKRQDISEYNLNYALYGIGGDCPISPSSEPIEHYTGIHDMFISNSNHIFYMLNDLFGYILNVQQSMPLSSKEKKKDDIQTGQDFENYIADLLIKLGYENVEVTKSSGDFGVDVLAERDKIKYAIQCKYYSSPVSNKAVQEVFTGKAYYNANIGIVVTNNVFTPAAEEQAKASGVILWDKYDLERFEQQTQQ